MRWLCVVGIVCCAPSAALAGNDDGVLVGNEAAMTGGAVCAIVGDGSAAWYNPAGIARVDRNAVDVNGSAFVLRIGVAPGLLSSESGNEADGGYVELVSVPSALTLVRDLGGGVHGAFGVFVPRFHSHTDIVGLEEPTADGLTRWQLTESVNASEWHIGGALGFRVDPRLRLGVALFAAYRNVFYDASFAGGYVAADGTPLAAFAVSGRANLEALGAEIAVGMQWQPIDELHVGLSIVSPGLNFAARYRVVGFGVSGSADGTVGFGVEDEGELQPAVGMISPARVRLGVAYAFDRGWIALEGDFQHPIDDASLGVARSWNWGLRAGTRFFLDPKIALGFGLFTDLSAEPEPNEFGRTRIDFFGGTAGVEIRNEHRLGEGESASTIEFSTTIALRYAVGVGTVGGLRFDPTSDGVVETTRVDTNVHELSLHIGSALFF